MKKTLIELKGFLLRSNVVDLAVGVIIGSAFGKIVSSLVNDVIMPPIGILLNGVNFTDLKIVLKEATVNAAGVSIPAVSVNYGTFLQTTIDFILMATVIFFIIKAISAFKKKEEKAPSTLEVPTKEQELLAEIRDLLKNK